MFHSQGLLFKISGFTRKKLMMIWKKPCSQYSQVARSRVARNRTFVFRAFISWPHEGSAKLKEAKRVVCCMTKCLSAVWGSKKYNVGKMINVSCAQGSNLLHEIWRLCVRAKPRPVVEIFSNYYLLFTMFLQTKLTIRREYDIIWYVHSNLRLCTAYTWLKSTLFGLASCWFQT